MLAKVPPRRGDGGSNFSKLVLYISERDNDEDKFDDELHYGDAARYRAILGLARGHLQAADSHLQAIGRIARGDDERVRANFERAGAFGVADRWGHGSLSPDASASQAHDTGTGQGVGDDDQHQRRLAVARNHLEAAERYLVKVRATDGNVLEGARARRDRIAADLATARSALAQYAGDDSAQLTREELDALSLQCDVVSKSGVVCRHNCLSLETAAAEMHAVAVQNARVKDPVYHAIVSWPEGEVPTDEQAFTCGAHALDAVGMAGHQFVFAVHRDTDNVHLHIAVNRVNPDTFRAVYPDRDFFRLDKAMRELELRFGWRHDNGPYAVFERDGRRVVDWATSVPRTKEKQPAAAQDMERFRDSESFFSFVRGDPRAAAVAILRMQSATWQELHATLKGFGLELREKGQGLAVYSLADASLTPIKASDMHEAMSKSRLVKRLGPYQASSAADVLATTTYSPARPAPLRDPQKRAMRREERAAMRAGLREEYRIYRKAFVVRRLAPQDVRARLKLIRDQARWKREQVRDTVSHPAARRALYSVISFELARDLELEKLAISRERAQLRVSPSNRPLSFQAWTESQAAFGDERALAQLRGWAYQERRDQRKALDQNAIEIPGRTPIGASDIESRTTILRSGAVVYKDEIGAVLVDRGDRIVLTDGAAGSGRDSEWTAVRLASARPSSGVVLHGTAGFKQKIFELLLEHKIDLLLLDPIQRAELETLRREYMDKNKPRSPRSK